MKEIDKEIEKLQALKREAELKIIKEKNSELDKFVKSLKGKFFKKYGGTNMCGNSTFSYITFFSFSKSSKVRTNECTYTGYGPGIIVHISVPVVYKRTYFDYAWSDPDYDKSGGTDKWKSHKEGSVLTGIKFKSEIFNKKDVASIEKQNYTIYGYGVDITSKEEFEHEYKECSKEEYDKVMKVCETTNNYIYQELYEACFNSNISKHAHDSSHILSITSKEKADEILEKVDFIYNKIKDLNTRVSYDFIKDLIK